MKRVIPVLLLLILPAMRTTLAGAQTPPSFKGLVVPLDYEQRGFYPASVATGPNGWFYVTDPTQHRILAFDENGETRWTLEDPALLAAPLGIDVDRDGRLYVADPVHQAVNVFSSGGALERTVTGTEDEPLKGPDAVALDDDLNLYVVDANRSRILKFDPQGTLITAWGSPGTGQGQFQGASDLEIADDGSLFVLETQNSRVQRFSAEGEPLDMWGSRGRRDNDLQYPKGFTLNNGHLLITDTLNYRMKEFDLQGNFIMSWGGWAGAGGVFVAIVDAAVGPGGCTLVVDVGRMYLFCQETPVHTVSWGDLKRRWADGH